MALRVAENIKMLSGREFGRELETALSDEQLVRLFPGHSVTGIAVENLCALDFIAIIGFEIKFTDSSDTNTQYCALLSAASVATLAAFRALSDNRVAYVSKTA